MLSLLHRSKRMTLRPLVTPTLPPARGSPAEAADVRVMNTHFLDQFSVPMVFVLFAVVTLTCFEIGFRVGRWWQDRMPGEQEGPTDMLVGSLLALMAFVLAITMGMAADRFDIRRGNVLDEANAIGTTFQRADYLPAAPAQAVQEIMREYLPLRISSDDLAVVQANLQRSIELHAELRAITREVAQSGHSPDLVSSFGESVNEIISVNQTRVVAGLYARVPETIMILLLAGSALSLAMVGYSGGLQGRRSVLSAVVTVVALGAVTTLVVDLDRPQDGFLRVSQQALLDVQAWIGQPTP